VSIAPSVAEANKALFRSFLDACNAGDSQAVWRLWAPNTVHHESALDCAPSDVYALMSSFMYAFPDLRFEIEQLIADGDIVAARLVARGTQQGEFMGLPPSGQPVDVTIMAQVRIIDGRMVEHWNVIDEVHLMEQLGLSPGTFFDAGPLNRLAHTGSARRRLIRKRRGRALAAPVPVHRMLMRLTVIVAIAGTEAVRTLPAAVMLRVLRGRTPARRCLYRGIVRALQTLGPTFVKFGQMSAARADAMPAELCQEMSRLHDAVTPMSRRQVERALRMARDSRRLLRAATVHPEPVGSGSIACVYSAVLPDGAQVALKLKRPNIDRRMQCDLALLEAMARAGQRLPKMRGMPIADLVGYVSKALLGQLDFDREVQHIARIRDSLASLPNVRVPAPYTELSSANCLVFEYVPGLDANTPSTLPGAVRARLGALVLAAVGKLFFEDGLVHCDLHPGNLYVTNDQQVVILDAGYCVQLPDRVRRLIGEFFMRMAMGDGRRCGEIVLESAVNIDTSTDREGFVSDVAELVARAAGPENDYDSSVFGDAIYNLQQRYGIYAASDFAFPLMSLLVVEGTVRRLWPEVDFQAVGGAAAPPIAA
jgi:ubiquinone biosynthesis protein